MQLEFRKGYVKAYIVIKDAWFLDPCVPNPCGEGAVCDSKTGNAICSCPKGRSGDPLLRCGKFSNLNQLKYFNSKVIRVLK